MKLRDFLRDKLIFILISVFTALFSATLFYVLGDGIYPGAYIACIIVLGQTAALGLEYFQKQSFYKPMLQSMEKLDRKYLISEMLDEPSFSEGKLLYDLIRAVDKSMNDEISKYRIASKEYREYIEAWVHEVKTPISSSRLIMENNPGEVTDNLSEELTKIENFVEQTLFYSRSSNVEKDYIIRRTTLKELVNPVLKKHSRLFIEGRVSVSTSGLDEVVFTDIKWTDFILGQILMNSVKYRGESPKVELIGTKNQNSVSLTIRDNGAGIPKKDLAKVFEKGFTGDNGRALTAKSTGMGLYLCKKLCKKMNLGITVDSVQHEGTTVTIVFPASNMYA